MNFPKEYYVTLTKLNELAFPLGFATPNGTDAAAKKRKETADNWARLPQTITFDNTPISGFSLGDSVTRYSTSNKFVRVSDPRGFVLEISITNLCEVIEQHTIVKGDIEGKFIWGREGGTNVLIDEFNPEYIESLAPFKTLEIGDWYTVDDGFEYRETMKFCYLGTHLASLGFEIFDYSNGYPSRKDIREWEYKDDPKKWHVSAALERCWNHQKNQGLPPQETVLHFKRSKPKKFKKIEKDGILDFERGVTYNAITASNFSKVIIK